MKWLVENWFLVVVVLSLAVWGIVAIFKYAALPTSAQKRKIKEWLLYAVTEAEREYGNGTGKIKLRAVYDRFLIEFDWLAQVISFEKFSDLVDDALVEMKQMLTTNPAVAEYVTGEVEEEEEEAEEAESEV